MWAFHFYLTLPPPPGPDLVHLTKLDQQVDALTKQIDSLKTAVNMRQLR